MKPLKDKVALVTGASRGIGQAIALRLGVLGATVVGTATSQGGADNISAYLKENSIEGFGAVLDVTSQESIESALSTMADSVGLPLILVNNAGVTADNLFMRMKANDWDRILDANLSGAFRTTHACIKPMMKARFGRIVNISSVVASIGNPGQANYAAAKAGLIGFSKSLAREIGSRGITVNVVSPGYIDTDMTRGLNEEQQKKLHDQIPTGRIGEPADIANAVGFLVLPESGYITGETLHVNGGLHMS